MLHGVKSVRFDRIFDPFSPVSPSLLIAATNVKPKRNLMSFPNLAHFGPLNSENKVEKFAFPEPNPLFAAIAAHCDCRCSVARTSSAVTRQKHYFEAQSR